MIAFIVTPTIPESLTLSRKEQEYLAGGTYTPRQASKMPGGSRQIVENTPSLLPRTSTPEIPPFPPEMGPKQTQDLARKFH
jgi:hypothetical protein